jgi:hypothetical protein
MKKSQATVCGSNSFNASLALAMMVPATCFCGIILLECGTRIILDWLFEVLRSLYGNAIEVVYIQHFYHISHLSYQHASRKSQVASRKREARRSRLDMRQFCNSVLKGKGELPSDTLGASELTKDKLPTALRGIQHTRTRRIQPRPKIALGRWRHEREGEPVLKRSKQRATEL